MRRNYEQQLAVSHTKYIMKALKCKTLGGIQYTMHCQGPCIILRMRVECPLPRVGPRLYLACFTAVAPVASL